MSSVHAQAFGLEYTCPWRDGANLDTWKAVELGERGGEEREGEEEERGGEIRKSDRLYKA